jgi:16S rRNA processing protein RimM
MTELALVGRVARAHGNRGEVIVNPETDFPDERFRQGAALVIDRGGQTSAATITSVRFHRGRPILGLSGVTTMDDAEALAGAMLKVPASALAALPAGTFYRHDLVGCRVETSDGRLVGTVHAVEGELTQSRLVVQAEGGGEILIPFASDICTTIDPAARRIVVEPPEGLLELNR